MPNGDFDRQQHQKEVIIAIAQKLIKKADITLFLNAIEAAGDKFSTNLTLNQLTSMFNMILNTKNYTGLKVSKLIDFQQLRLTGYASWYYNYSMNLPLWIYKIYDGSYDEAIGHAQSILGMNVNTSDQTYEFKFDANIPYERPQLYQSSYDEEHVDEPMPAYYPNLTGMLYGDVQAWAKENGISLDVTFITRDDAGYDKSQDGYVISQNPRYGMLLSDYPTAKITVMGDGKTVVVGELLDYTGMNYKDVEQWAKDHGYNYALRQTYVSADDLDESENNVVYKVDIDDDGEGDILKIRFYTICNGVITDGGKGCSVADSYVGKSVSASFEKNGIKYTVNQDKETYDQAQNNIVYQQDTAKNGEIVLHTYKYVAHDHSWQDVSGSEVAATCTEDGYKTQKCSKCGATQTVKTIDKLGHDWKDTGETHDATCVSEGYKVQECSRCHTKQNVKTADATGNHTWVNGDDVAATCTEGGYTPQTCSVCGATQKTNVTDALGHNWVDIEGDDTHQKCDRCNETREKPVDNPS